MARTKPRTLSVEYVDLTSIRTAARNPKAHDLPAIRASMQRHGLGDVAGIVDSRTGRLVAGHGRVECLRDMLAAGDAPPAGVHVDGDAWSVPVLVGARWKNAAEAEAFLLAHNRTTELGGWDQPALDSVLDDLRAGPGLAGTGFPDLDSADKPLLPAEARSLADRFLVPPFSVLDARQGYWQERKRAWLALGIRSEVGRPTNDLAAGGASPNRSVASSPHAADPGFYAKKRAVEKVLGREISGEEFIRDHWDGRALSGTSVFDPVLCELVYRWFSPEGGTVLDPFAGGSVRGVVAGFLGRHYHGIDLSKDQVEANRAQARSILGSPVDAEWTPGDPADLLVPGAGPDGVDLVFSAPPLYLAGLAAEQLADLAESMGDASWTVGDSSAVLDAGDGPDDADLVFSCPPYFDLEVYSDDPADLSNVGSYDAFLAGYRRIIRLACDRLADDRFAVWVVGDVRDRDGRIRGLVSDTIDAFEAAGLAFHNDAILVTALGSLPSRSARSIVATRRLARGHQYVLTFCKGDAKAAAEACGTIEVSDPAERFGEVVTAPAEVDA